MHHQVQFNFSPENSFSHKINQDYLNCSLIGKNIIDVEIYLTKEFKTLKASYSYDSLMAEFKNLFESCQNLFQFLKNHSTESIKIKADGLAFEINQKGVKSQIFLSLSTFNMTEKETRDLVDKLIEDNRNLSTQIQKQTIDYNILMDQMLNQNEKLSKQKQSSHQSKEDLDSKQDQYSKIPKTKIIKKTRQDPRTYQLCPKYLSYQQPRVIKECEVCQKLYQGKDYFKWCMSCFDRNKPFIKRLGI